MFIVFAYRTREIEFRGIIMLGFRMLFLFIFFILFFSQGWIAGGNRYTLSIRHSIIVLFSKFDFRLSRTARARYNRKDIFFFFYTSLWLRQPRESSDLIVDNTIITPLLQLLAKLIKRLKQNSI